MSRVFTENGRSIPVTLIEATPEPHRADQDRRNRRYSAVQVTVGARRAALVNKPEAGHFAKAKVEAGRGLWEFRVEDAQLGDFRRWRRSQGGHLRSRPYRRRPGCHQG